MKKERKHEPNMNDYVVGIDIGEKESYATYLSPSGDTLEDFSFSTNDSGFGEFGSKIPTGVRNAFEASGLAYVVSDKLRSMGYNDLTVAHPKELSWIIKSKKKNDHVDSIKLAKLHMVHMIPESHLLPENGRIFRDLLIQRTKLGSEISRMKNSITGYLKREGRYDTLPKSVDKFSEKRMKAIRKITFGNDKDLVLKTMLDRLSFLQDQIPSLEERIRSMAKDSEDVRLLMSIPGIDYYLASLISSHIGDAKRFPDESRLASFFGIVPANHDSSSIKRRGHMSKDGSSTARWALSIAVDTVKLRNKAILDYYNHQKQRTGSGKLAHVLTMRKLVRMMYFMLTQREEWKYENHILTKKKLSKLDGISG